jgi:hypothetical protein
LLRMGHSPHTWCPCTCWIDSSEPGVVRRFVAPVETNRFSQSEGPKVGTTSVVLQCHRSRMVTTLLEKFNEAPKVIPDICVTISEPLRVVRNERFMYPAIPSRRVSAYMQQARSVTRRKTNRERVLLFRTPQLSSRSHSAAPT